MRIPFIAGNWKMNLSAKEAVKLTSELHDKIMNIEENRVTIAICPVFVHLAHVHNFLETISFGPAIELGAQNLHWEKSGAFTGEISGAMLAESGCRYVIVGHSERRHIMGEDNEIVARKVAASFEHGLLPIICVGETLEEREGNNTTKVVKTQVQKALEPLTSAQIEVSTIAYEPVWAIGTGKAATPEMAQEVHKMIRDTLANEYGQSLADNVRIQYGGSVKPSNVNELMAQPDIDGALVGGASLKADSFAQLIKSAAAIEK